MDLKKTLLIAAVMGIAALACWEFYWRSQGKVPDLDDEKGLWAVQRARLESFTKEDVVLLGSSRVLFDIQLNEWETATGRRPLQLASAGTTPLPMFRDLVENTDYSGTVILGVTPGLFFSTTFPLAPPWKRAQNRVDHYHNRTYAQQFNHHLSIPLQRTFAYLSTGEEEWSDDNGLKPLLRRLAAEDRIKGSGMPPFNNFMTIDEDRNTRMMEEVVTDTAFANSIKRVWQFFGQGAPPPDKASTMAFFLQDAKKFMGRGGNLILLQCPSSGGLKMGESMALPRADFWDDLVRQTGAKAYHYEDYPELNKFDCPEWSHLSAADAQRFTTSLAQILIRDGVIANPKN